MNKVNAVLQWIGGFVIVIIIYYFYRQFTDDYITDLFWRGFLASTFITVLFNIWKDIRKL